MVRSSGAGVCSSVRSPQPGQRKYAMFSRAPSSGTFACRSTATARPVSRCDTSAGVTTSSAAMSVDRLSSPCWMSPVPGGRSTTSTSSSPQTVCRTSRPSISSANGPAIVRPWSPPSRKPTEATFRPSTSTASSAAFGAPIEAVSVTEVALTSRRMPSIRGTSGPCRSASSSPTRRPRRTSSRARLTATLVLPTPPFPLATATTGGGMRPTLLWRAQRVGSELIRGRSRRTGRSSYDSVRSTLRDEEEPAAGGQEQPHALVAVAEAAPRRSRRAGSP